ncbi:ArsR family transcriptional regulator [Frondihabitans sp. PAMC 28766]|nr:ArsR family transcriptional regulator [Frondihabitans sp. PAMC 28766]
MSLGAVMAALADPSRRKVVTDLLFDPPGVERTCTSFGLPVTKSTRTHHFRVLREAGLVYDLDLGNRSSITLRRDDLDQRFPGLLDLVAAEAATPTPSKE